MDVMKDISYCVFDDVTTAKIVGDDSDSWKAVDLLKIVFERKVNLSIEVDYDLELNIKNIKEYTKVIKISGIVEDILQAIHNFFKDLNHQSHVFFEGLSKGRLRLYYLSLGS
jgi:hypothetical protein